MIHPVRTRQSGFTLVELMVVIGIVGLLAAVSVPAVRNYVQWSRLAGATQVLEADLHYAHALAKEQRRTYEIRFGAGTYSIVQVSPPDTLRTRTMPDGVACVATDDVAFYAWGLTEPVTLTISNAHDAKVMQLSANGHLHHE